LKIKTARRNPDLFGRQEYRIMKYYCTLCDKKIAYIYISDDMVFTSLQICQILMEIEAGGDNEK
jgi:hypothetical protein